MRRIACAKSGGIAAIRSKAETGRFVRKQSTSTTRLVASLGMRQ